MKLYKDSRLDQTYELSAEEIAARFMTSKWADMEGTLDRILRDFLTANEADGGLASAFEETDYDEVFDAVFAARHAANPNPD